MAELDDLLAAIEAGPQLGGQEQGMRRPIGISEGAEIELAERGAPPPRYTSGYEFFPGTRSPEWRARLQTALDAAGMYGDKPQYRRGVWDPGIDAKAFGDLLGVANANGWSWQEAIVEMGRVNAEGQRIGGSARGGGGGRGSGAGLGPSATAQVTNPSDLKVLADRVSRSSIGKKLEPEQMERFVQAYQSIEQAEAQQRIAQAEGVGPGGVQTAPPTPQTFFEEKTQREMPQEVQARKMVEKFEVFDKMLGGLGGRAARPGQGGGTQGV